MPYPILALLDLLFTAVSCLFFNWWVAWLCPASGYLPDRLKWFQTFDAPLDQGWQSGMAGYQKPSGPLSSWWERTKWLYRNPAYGFSYWYLGLPFDEKQWTVLEDTKTQDLEYFHAVGPMGQFSIIYFGKWGMLKLGWKAWNYFDHETSKWRSDYKWGPEKRVPIVFSYTPFKRKGV